MRGDGINITIGEAVFNGRLPHMRYRFELYLAWRRALGFKPGDDDKQDENGRSVPTGEPDGDDMLGVALAAIGLCWDDKPLDVPSFRIVRRRIRAANNGDDDEAVLEFGECVYDALFDGGHDPQALYDTGVKLIGDIGESIPTKAEITEAEDPTAAPGESYTANT